MAVTAWVTTVHVALVLPAGTDTLAGIEAMALPPLTMASATDMVVARGFPKVTLPVLEEPPVTELGVKVTAVGVFAVTVRFPLLLAPLAVAETVTVVFVETSVVTIVKVAVLEPERTVTDEGIEITADPPAVTASVTEMFPCAVPLRVTVPVLL